MWQQRWVRAAQGLWLVFLAFLVGFAASTSHKLQVRSSENDVPRRRFDGIGALSAGASSRLLRDYPEKERAEILDLLFLPGYGASLQVLKVEIGADTQSTDGSEASHMRFAEETPTCERGYETWLLAEAKKRNPSIITQGLAWGVPGWIGNGNFFSHDNLRYHVSWLTCVRDKFGVEVDYIGIWNESPWGEVWYIDSLRQEIDKNGLTTKLVLLDEILGADASFINHFKSNQTFRGIVDAVGLHYPCEENANLAEALKLRPETRMWASEELSTVADWGGAGCWGRLINQNFVRMSATSSIAWSLIWSAYPNLECFGNGLLYAFEPWSGHYDVRPPVWATAHTTQFTAVGWEYIPVGSGSGTLPEGGTHVVLVSPDGKDFTAVFETLQGRCFYHDGCFHHTEASRPQTLRLHLDLPGAANRLLYQWQTNQTHWFVQQGSVRSDDSGTVEVTVFPDTMLTLTSVSRGEPVGRMQAKQQAALPPGGSQAQELGFAKHAEFPEVKDMKAPPATSEFPLPFSQAFDGLDLHSNPRFFADQGGAFEVVSSPAELGSASRNQVLEQQLERPPIAWHGYSPEPWTLVGGVNWTDISAEVSARISPSGSVHKGDHTDLCVRLARYHFFGGSVGYGDSGAPPEGYCLKVFQGDGGPEWSLTVASQPLNGGALSGRSADAVAKGSWVQLRLEASRSRIRAWVDGAPVASLVDTSYPIGQVALKCGYHRCQFDNLEVERVQPSPVATFAGSQEDSLVQHFQLAIFDYHRRSCDPSPQFPMKRTDLDGWAGFAFRPRKPLAVTALGTMVVAGRTVSDYGARGQNVSLVDVRSGRIVASAKMPIGRVAQAHAGDDGWVWEELPVPVRLERQSEYFLVVASSRSRSTEQFYDAETSLSLSSETIPCGPVFYEYGSWSRLDAPRTSAYGPVNARLAPASFAPPSSRMRREQAPAQQQATQQQHGKEEGGWGQWWPFGGNYDGALHATPASLHAGKRNVTPSLISLSRVGRAVPKVKM